MSEFKITKGSDLLSLKALASLEPKDRKAYDAAAAAFAEQFNTAFPNGKKVKVDIVQFKLGERVNVVVEKHNDLSTQAFGFGYNVTDAIADNLVGVADTGALVAISHAALEPLTLTVTVKAVTTADTFTESDGTVRNFQCPAMVKIDGSREEIELSADAKEVLAAVYQKDLETRVFGNGGKAKPRKAVSTKAVVPEVEDAEV